MIVNSSSQTRERLVTIQTQRHILRGKIKKVSMYKPYHRIKHQWQECTKKEKKKHLTLASRVFPVPGAPVKRIPCKYVRVRLYNVQITKNR
jgi:hypothetical protein